MSNRQVSEMITGLEALAVHPDAPGEELDRLRDNLFQLFNEAGLDPADPLHRRSFCLGLIGSKTFARSEFEMEMNSMAILRPPVTA